MGSELLQSCFGLYMFCLDPVNEWLARINELYNNLLHSRMTKNLWFTFGSSDSASLSVLIPVIVAALVTISGLSASASCFGNLKKIFIYWIKINAELGIL